MSNNIIGGHTCGSTGTCGTSGIHSVIGSTGMQGTSGPAGLIDWKEELMKKYPRFTIKTVYVANQPSNIIIDNNTGVEYKLTSPSNKPLTMYGIIDETEQFIKELIIDIREEKITSIISEK